MTSVVIQTAFLGDVVLTTPLLQAVAKLDGEPVDVVTTPRAASLLQTHPAVRTVVPYDKRGSDRGVRALLRVAQRLRATRYRASYLPHRSLRAALLARFAGIPHRIGFTTSRSRWLYTHTRPWEDRLHESDRMLALADVPPGAFRPSLSLTQEDHELATRWLNHEGLCENCYVALAPGSVWSTKRWPYYRGLAERLAPRIAVVLVGAVEEQPLVAGWTSSGMHDAVGVLPIRASTALIQRAAVLVTNDSAPLHLAGAVGTPVVAIFGPTAPMFGFGPRGPFDRVVGIDDLPCRPCSRHGRMRCPLDHHRCMRDLSPDAVLNVVKELYALRHGR